MLDTAQRKQSAESIQCDRGRANSAAQRISDPSAIDSPRAQQSHSDGAQKIPEALGLASPVATNRGAHQCDEPHLGVSPATDHGDVGAHISSETNDVPSPAIAVIVNLYRQHRVWLRARVKLELQAQAWCRSRTDGDKEVAAKLWRAAQRGDGDMALLMVLVPFMEAIGMWDSKLAPVRLQLEKMAAKTHYHGLIPRGFGAFNLACLIGECGEIEGYRNPSCLWKRMGLAVIDGERQQKKANVELALVHGYVPQRRALAYVIGDCLLRAKSPVKAVYEERKAKKIAEGWSKLRAHRDAKMFMVKRVLRDMWIAAQPSPG